VAVSDSALKRQTRVAAEEGHREAKSTFHSNLQNNYTLSSLHNPISCTSGVVLYTLFLHSFAYTSSGNQLDSAFDLYCLPPDNWNSKSSKLTYQTHHNRLPQSPSRRKIKLQ
jgi:hypothetical protein